MAGALHRGLVDRFRRAVLSRRITPAQTVPDDEDDAADDPAVIDPRICASDSQIRSLMATPPRAAIESTGSIVAQPLRVVHKALR